MVYQAAKKFIKYNGVKILQDAGWVMLPPSVKDKITPKELIRDYSKEIEDEMEHAYMDYLMDKDLIEKDGKALEPTKEMKDRIKYAHEELEKRKTWVENS